MLRTETFPRKKVSQHLYYKDVGRHTAQKPQTATPKQGGCFFIKF